MDFKELTGYVNGELEVIRLSVTPDEIDRGKGYVTFNIAEFKTFHCIGYTLSRFTKASAPTVDFKLYDLGSDELRYVPVTSNENFLMNAVEVSIENGEMGEQVFHAHGYYLDMRKFR